MAEQSYLKPTGLKTSDMGVRKRQNGMFQNTAPHPQLGGFSSDAKLPGTDRPLAMEKGELTRKGRPI
jgi:hypothetical protein